MGEIPISARYVLIKFQPSQFFEAVIWRILGVDGLSIVLYHAIGD